MVKHRNIAEIGERLRITRQALGQTQFCRAASIEPNIYNQYEKAPHAPEDR